MLNDQINNILVIILTVKKKNVFFCVQVYLCAVVVQTEKTVGID